MAEQCDSLDRAWFGEMWFRVERYTYHVQSSVTYDSIPDPADLDLDEGYSEPDLCFSRSQVRDPAYALLDSAQGSSIIRGNRESSSWKGESQVLAQRSLCRG